MRSPMKTCERGQVLVLVALVLVVLLGFAALAVDVGYMYTVYQELQRCADAGALAGASILRQDNVVTWSSPPPSIPPRWDRANSALQYYAVNNMVSAAPPSPVNVDNVSQLPNGIGVRTSCTVNLFFARIFGMPSVKRDAYAEAEAVWNGTGTAVIVRLRR